MTIDKAIKNLKRARKDCGMIPPEEYTPTIDLAVEALEFYLREKRANVSGIWSLLPGETKD